MIADAQPGDIYIDTAGKLWRITEVIREPTIEAEEVEGSLDDPNAPHSPLTNQGLQGAPNLAYASRPARIVKRKQRAFLNAGNWNGWRRIWRRETATTEAT